jgi:hypothetical protein
MLKNQILPTEKVVLCGALLAIFASVVFNLPLVKPGVGAYLVFLVFFLPTYFLFLILIAVFPNLKISSEGAIKIARNYFALFVGCYFCYATKHWSHLLNAGYYDESYKALDVFLAPVLAFETGLNNLLHIPISVESYILAFQLAFYIAFLTCFLAGAQSFYACCAALAINLVVGGFSYSIAPAYGPFTYWPIEQWDDVFIHYVNATAAFKQSAGAVYDSKSFIFSLGAMPSLHISIPFTFTWYMWKANKSAGCAGLLISLYCFVHAKLTGFHYYADLFAGMLLAAIAIWVANWLTRQYFKNIAY